MKKLIERATVLAEALPYLRRFAQKTFVIKYGGSAMVEESLKNTFAADVVLLKYIGINPVIVHGGGPQIDTTLKRFGKSTSFVQGLRVTDAETMEVVEMVLGGMVNKEIVRLMNRHGGRAVGLTGSDGGLITARKLKLKRSHPRGRKGTEQDLGRVGEVAEVDTHIIEETLRGGMIPVIAPTGVGRGGEVYNINADSAAGRIAGALRAEKFLILTDVRGILDGKGSLLPHLGRGEALRLKRKKVISRGMIPKVEACLDALKGGVVKAHIIDGRIPHAILLETFTDRGIGTELVL